MADKQDANAAMNDWLRQRRKGEPEATPKVTLPEAHRAINDMIRGSAGRQANDR